MAGQFAKLALCAQILLTGQMASAQMLPTDQVMDRYMMLDQRDTLIAQVDRADVQAQIIALGVDPAEARNRLAALSDSEVASIVTQIQNESAGGDIVGTMFTIFVILLVTDLLCATKVFNFTRCVR